MRKTEVDARAAFEVPISPELSFSESRSNRTDTAVMQGCLQSEPTFVPLLGADWVGHRRTYRRGEEIIGDGEPVHSIFFIVSGVVKLTKLLEDGRLQLLCLQFPDDIVGRPLETISTTSAEAATGVELCQISMSAYRTNLIDNSAFKQQMLDQCLRELDEARKWQILLGRKTAAERVASFLCYVAMRTDPSWHDREVQEFLVELPLGRADIANHLGLTVETVSRHLTRLRMTGVLGRVENRFVRIANRQMLEKLAELEFSC